jgi:endothelin-converting enzyme
VKHAWSELYSPRDPDVWKTNPLFAAAIYEPQDNAVVLPIALMQSPVFETTRPEYLNYGSFGALVGHEITHAIDPRGRHFDVNGNYKDWWSYYTDRQYKEKSKCFEDEMSHALESKGTATSAGHDINTTVVEDVAVATGVELAFKAWEEARDGHKANNYKLPGLSEFSEERLFFLAFGNMWCSSKQSRNAHRAFRALRHLEEFRRSWECQDRQKICKVW